METLVTKQRFTIFLNYPCKWIQINTLNPKHHFYLGSLPVDGSRGRTRSRPSKFRPSLTRCCKMGEKTAKKVGWCTCIIWLFIKRCSRYLSWLHAEMFFTDSWFLAKGRSALSLNRCLSTCVLVAFNREPHLFTSHFYLEYC